MRRLILPFIGFAIGMMAVSLMAQPRVGVDTPVSVLAAEPVILALPVSPSVARVVTDLRDELAAVGETTNDPRIASALERAGTDTDLLQRVAESPVEKFDSGEAVATATPLLDIDLDPERVVVTVITVELVPGYGSTAGSREHEDGHALINERIARRCAGDALRTGVEAGYQGQSLINYMMVTIYDSADPVHIRYHSYVAGARYGQHIRYAEQALQDIDGCALSPSRSA